MAAEESATATTIIYFIELLLQVAEENRAKLFYPNLPAYCGGGEWEKGYFIQKISKIPVKVTR